VPPFLAEAYMCAKCHLDPSNRLATIHERQRQTGQVRQTDRQDRIHQRHRQDRQTDNGLVAHGEPFYKRLPKMTHFLKHSITKLSQKFQGQNRPFKSFSNCGRKCSKNVFAALYIWNGLSNDVISAGSLLTFQRLLKRFCFISTISSAR